MSDPVVVIGGSLAGLAAAARLAKAGHAVELYEKAPVLGGRWAPYALSDTGVMVDDAPAVLSFPAPWRDLFRKSGRPLEAELARSGFELVPAEPVVLVFDDGAELVLPTDRGEQYATLSAAYGRPVAERWRDLLDRLDDTWQALRPLGFELELRGRRQLSRPVRRRLLHRRTVADLAAAIDHPHLGALINSVAYRQGSDPRRTPAFAAVELSVLRTFGRWQVQPVETGTVSDRGRSSVLVEVLGARLRLRKVVVRLGTEVTGVVVRGGRATAITTSDGERPVSAVISTADPWETFGRLLPGPTRSLRRLRPALAPSVSHEVVDQSGDRVCETVRLSRTGVPVVSYDRPDGVRTVRSTHDFGSGSPDRAYGLAWRGFGSWTARPPIRTGVDGVFTAGPFSAAGPGASATILSGALASYATHDRSRDIGAVETVSGQG